MEKREEGGGRRFGGGGRSGRGREGVVFLFLFSVISLVLYCFLKEKTCISIGKSSLILRIT